MTLPKHLTKSRFSMGLKSVQELWFALQTNTTSTLDDDSFMQTLAQDGMLIGALAQTYYPNGTNIETLDIEDALQQTATAIGHDNIVIFEPAFRVGNLLVRVDVLIKNGSHIDLIEVKAKSIDTNRTHPLRTVARNAIESQWKPYLIDIAFQKHVVSKSLSNLTVTAFLMGVDKRAKCTVPQLNQQFTVEINENGNRTVQRRPECYDQPVCNNILKIINVDREVEETISDAFGSDKDFEDKIAELDALCSGAATMNPTFGWNCRDSDYINTGDHSKSGVHQCFAKNYDLPTADFNKPNVFDLPRTVMNNGIDLTTANEFFLDTTTYSPGDATSETEKFTIATRIKAQIDFAKGTGLPSIFKRSLFETERTNWTYPLHFIDFETSTPVIPFIEAMRPYETIAFQFSHHNVSANGQVTHATQFINLTPGEFPNFEFLRALKGALSVENGTIFCYSHHENTVLNHIYVQLLESNEPDRQELMNFVETVAKPARMSPRDWTPGPRNMVDLCKLTKDYYIHPRMKASMKIKDVLPAVLEDSEFLADEYSGNKYGSEIKSLNFKTGISWYQERDDGTVMNPYRLLEPINLGPVGTGKLESINNITDGTAALTAYSLSQTDNLSESQRQALRQGLLKYCELDTLAMVMIYQAWIA
ncbi:MAG TPA: DUF2779 domain-containing protein [Dehalococcoidia bacterium]|nr:DUF2779 domain-containing protein [Dehalococcoidia bacterium]